MARLHKNYETNIFVKKLSDTGFNLKFLQISKFYVVK